MRFFFSPNEGENIIGGVGDCRMRESERHTCGVGCEALKLSKEAKSFVSPALKVEIRG